MKKKIVGVVLIIVSIAIVMVSFVGCKPKSKEILTEYQMDLSLDWQSKKLSAKQTINYTNNESVALETIKCYFNPNAFANPQALPIENGDFEKAYPMGLSLAQCELSLKVDGEITAPVYENLTRNVIDIKLKQPLLPRAEILLLFEYSIVLPYNTLRFGYNENSVNLANFYPQIAVFDDEWKAYDYFVNGDPFYSDMANFEVNFVCDKEIAVLGSGNSISESKIDKNTYKFGTELVRDFAIVASDSAQILSGKIGDTEVNYLSFADKTPQKTLDVGMESLRVYEQLFGEYIYSTLNICEVDFLYGGMEFSGLIYITKGLNEYGMQRVVSHEVAHQWWYNAVGNDQVKNAWQDEAITEFSTALYFAETGQDELREMALKDARSNFGAFGQMLNQLELEIDQSMTRAIDEYANSLEYTIMVYDKGMMMFDSVYVMMGHTDFVAACKKYYQAYKYTIASPNQLIEVFGIGKKADMSGVFASWLSGTAVIGGNI